VACRATDRWPRATLPPLELGPLLARLVLLLARLPELALELLLLLPFLLALPLLLVERVPVPLALVLALTLVLALAPAPLPEGLAPAR
jgi:hypothetical protein